MNKSIQKNLLQNIIEFGLSFRNERQHPIHVCQLCCRLFDGLQNLHHMGNTERIWLQAAALLHDIGKSICGRDHNKKSRDIIIKSANLPFDKKDRILIGLIARYHRGVLPSRSHKYFGKLDSESRYYVRKLAALLRFADGLDKNHRSSVTDISCKITEDNIIICPEITGAFNPRQAIARADLLEEVFGRRIVILEQLEPLFLSSEFELRDNLDFTDWQF
jgi:exopolyphosphatase/guanosine-5'-triphosphate,3'-diphosphate pyrophosphatase